MKTFDYIIILLSALLIFFAGMTLDRFYLTGNPNGIAISEVDNQAVPVLNIYSIGNGYLRGSVRGGEVRVVAGEEVSMIDDEGNLEVALINAFENYEITDVPEWAIYVASKSGKKYYPLSSSMARRIAPANRIYFASSGDAEQAGYVE